MQHQDLGERKTSQRAAIVTVIVDSEGPLTVTEIHHRACDEVPNMGIATVYRTVKLLLERNEISTISLGDGETRYEVASLAHHHHFSCNVCNQVFDLPGCMLPIPDGTHLPGGYRVERHEVTLFGTCPACHGE